MKNPDKVKEGKKSRRNGMLFEIKVREDLESKGWIVDRWSNQVDLKFKTDIINIEFSPDPTKKIIGHALNATEGKLVKAKSNRFNMRTCGFPDFIAFKNNKKDKFVWTVDTDNPTELQIFKDKLKEFQNEKNIIVPPAVKVKQLTKTEIIGVECKMKGKLSKEEKEKVQWLLKNNIFSKIFVASKSETGVLYDEIKRNTKT